MNTGYEGILQFRGKWRDYQERVLLHAQQYLKDGKIHIVAAPGSGKTTLGIELIRRLGAPCLIFSPSITIRQQWLMRIQEGFLTEEADPQEILSNNLKQMKQMTATTYQALYSAMKREQGTLEEDSGEAAEEDAAASEAVDGVDAADSKVAAGGVTEEADGEKETEQVDYRDFDIFKAVKEAGITTICLDEAHHLRSEWWKALETFLDKLPDVKIIALTATPPYDSTPAQWKRYIDMCGPIDEEIFTPELVREGSLCPHQDYVYFNWPTREEEAYVREHQKRMQMQVQKMMADETLRRIVSSHQGLMHPEEYSERFLDKPEYFTALLVYCQAKGIPFSGYLRKLIGTKGKLPGMDAHWMEVLLQGVLYEDRESYTMMEAERESLLQELKEQMGLTFIFITHDLSVVNHFADEIAVMYLGQLIEKAPTEELFDHPVHPYTRALLSAIPIPEVGIERPERILLRGEISSPIDPPDECRFAKRCNYVCDQCHKSCPQLVEISEGHFVSCHLWENFK